MSMPIRTLRTARSMPTMRRLHGSANKAKPSHLLSSIQSQYSALSVTSLKKECKTRGLRVSGRKAELVDRIVAFEATQQFSTTAAAQSIAIEPPAPAPPVKAAKPAKPAPPAQSFSTTAPAEAKNDNSSIDYFRMPEKVLTSQPVSEIPVRMVVPPDADYQAAEHAPRTVERRVPDESGKATVHDVSGSKVISSITDGDGDPKAHHEEEETQGQSLSGRDKNILWGLVAGVTAWWAAGSMFSSKKNKE